MTQNAVSITLGFDPQLAGPGFTVNGVASFDLASAFAFACDLLRHQGAPIDEGITLPVILAAKDLMKIAECIEFAYLEGPSTTFHTRLNEAAGGHHTFADLLIETLAKARAA